jgi:probable rRNA maturation factor
MITIMNRQRKRPIRTTTFKRLLERLVARHRLGDPELTLAFVGTAAIRTLNRKFRKRDRPTDVLSFPVRKQAADGRYYLGDIVISVPVAYRQGRRNGHGLERELEVLAVHGFLHLLGYNHSRAMEEQERTALGLDRA